MDDNKLHKKYGLFTAICMVVGIVIGSGVFLKAPGVLRNNNGNMLYSLLTVAAVGAVMVICASVFAILAGRISHVNGLVDYAEATLGGGYGYAVGWFASSIYYPCITSTLAWVSSNYTVILLGLADKGNLRFALATLYLIAAYFINTVSPKIAGKFQISTTVVKLIPLCIMAVIGTIVGLFSGQTGETLSSGSVATGQGTGFFGAVVAFAFAYEGWIIATTINAEIHDSKRNLPKALILGMLVTVAAYVGYFLGLAGVLSSSEIIEAGDALPMVAFTSLFGGNKFFGTLAYVFIIISCLGTLNGVMLGCCRGFYSIAERGQGPAPEVLSRIDPHTNMPVNSAIVAIAFTVLWMVQWEFGLIEQALPTWLNFENDELPIITLYLSYIPIFIAFMIKGKELRGWQRFILIPAAILCCVFMVYSAVAAYKIQSLYYLAVFAIFMGFGMLFYRVKGRTVLSIIVSPVARLFNKKI